ncbi:sugar ABC transporter ATP-binding protein [Sporomusaceae bacterium FL31]|nr:sugar ABC transporter ATP-binding protein [Sporomusaceae bacterium FL31]GCE33910.1 sugar ABC transporter ATP-binding protein [Sporomusaceae bacterium]
MSNIVIKVESLSKQYQLGTIGSGTLYRDIQSLWARVNGKEDPNLQVDKWDASQLDSNKSFWALKNVSFDIKQGDIVGIIGHNGAGKSTLLKILSRVTGPTSGLIKIKGRIASLLEVGTGFHPELTGRENVYLNGTILGMRKVEIDRKFNEIVEFAEISKFIDTPVKRYSSGMYVRLAFSVAAHLDPEILIVDEVLAVGDAAFQKKCLGKMQDVGKEGRTVLFVSHNMQAIRQLCHRCILLKKGEIFLDSDVYSVIDQHLETDLITNLTENLSEIISTLPIDPSFRLNSVNLFQDGKMVVGNVKSGSTLEIQIGYEILRQETGLRVFIDLCDATGEMIFRSFHDEDNDGIPIVTSGKYVSTVVVPKDFLGPTTYQLYIRAGIHNVRSCLPNGIKILLNVHATGMYNRAYVGDTFRGKIAPILKWITDKDVDNGERNVM